MKKRLVIDAELVYEPGQKSMKSHFRFADEQVDVSEGEKVVASMGGYVGGGYEIHDKRDGKVWRIAPPVVWDAFEKGEIKDS